jgi:hypothetical protein
MLLAVIGFWGLFYFNRLDHKAGAWFLLQFSTGISLCQLAFEHPAPGTGAPNPLALGLGVGAILAALLVGSLLMGMASFLKGQYGTWVAEEIGRRLKP